MEEEEAAEGVGAVALHAADHAVESFLFADVAGFGIEFIGVADEFLLNAQGKHVAMGEGEILADDVLQGESAAGVPFADEGMSRQAFSLQDFPPFDAMADIG